ncbi:MAG: SURF1 family protein [Nocardioides sp.]|nr:SURF1 family protein [Nocardioides sp.]
MSSEQPPVRPERPSVLTEIGAALLALVLVGIAVSLGVWQFNAWEARRTAEARDLTRNPPVSLTDLMGNDDPFPGLDVGRPVEVSGEWTEGGFWVSGREHEGADGYWAVAPLAVGGAGEPAVLVVRGWAAQPSPDLLAATGPASVTGWLQPPEGGLVTDDDAGDDVFPELRVADAVQRVDVDLYSAYLVLDPERSTGGGDGLRAAALDSLPQVDRFTGLKNLLYAIEWWIFGAFAAFIWWRWRRDAHAAVTAWETAEAGAVAQPVDG